MKSLLIAILSTFIASTAFAATYKNQNGSILIINKQPITATTGKIGGKFTTAVGDCKKDIGQAEDITGVYNGSTVSIAVNFPNCGEVVAMTGQIQGDELNTTWLDTHNTPGSWNSNLIGSDHYIQTS